MPWIMPYSLMWLIVGFVILKVKAKGMQSGRWSYCCNFWTDYPFSCFCHWVVFINLHCELWTVTLHPGISLSTFLLYSDPLWHLLWILKAGWRIYLLFLYPNHCSKNDDPRWAVRSLWKGAGTWWAAMMICHVVWCGLLWQIRTVI